MRVLVTGGAGFIGGQVATTLAAAGHDVVILDNLHPAAHRNRPSTMDGALIGDVRDPDALARALPGVDAVVHHAAMVGMGTGVADLPDYVDCNDRGTAVLLAGMAHAGVDRLVLASSMVVYGEGGYRCPGHGPVRPQPRAVADLAAGRFEPRCPRCGADLAIEPVDEDAPLAPRSGYAATKVAQEHLCTAWAYATGGRVVALRYHNVYGPGMPRDTPYAGVASIFRSALENGQAPRVFEDGRQCRDFIHVADVARANLAALAATDGPAGLRAYNIASGRPRTVGDLAAALSRALGGPQPEVTGAFRAGDVRHILASAARATRELGFHAEIGFAAGMAEFATTPAAGRDLRPGPHLLPRSGRAAPHE
jgi:dTDP-L-rhamnose 4-epimerase